ncbi:hypothetical protein Bhyg_08492 [Pseudolycoriella hygida]|uniref:Uncharacterized protein n=1 Tax=Pseudolycoriella hygida TaxID=35572 RepID=A0A9Q0S506_9DIPT|nr:hypothetical protein Bhyg_08492 [Pseudolycoriella hygida]
MTENVCDHHGVKFKHTARYNVQTDLHSQSKISRQFIMSQSFATSTLSTLDLIQLYESSQQIYYEYTQADADGVVNHSTFVNQAKEEEEITTIATKRMIWPFNQSSNEGTSEKYNRDVVEMSGRLDYDLSCCFALVKDMYGRALISKVSRVRKY